MESNHEVSNPILHVVVVGFHHKKGCQVEYSYPPLLSGQEVDCRDCPEEWKQLPSLALPDGAHNFNEDTVFFHLPSRDKTHSTVYCVSCYRQIMLADVLNPSEELTRNTVQKSVCVLSKLPLYGLIQAKLELITYAYFRGRDFSQVALLEDTYKTLNMSINESLLADSQAFVGLHCRELLRSFQHKLLVLFKLLLLERRVLFFSSPVKPICCCILTLASLFPGMIEHGLIYSASYAASRQLSPRMNSIKVANCEGDFVNVNYGEPVQPSTGDIKSASDKEAAAVFLRPTRTWSDVETSLEGSYSMTSDELTVIECQLGCSKADDTNFGCAGDVATSLAVHSTVSSSKSTTDSMVKCSASDSTTTVCNSDSTKHGTDDSTAVSSQAVLSEALDLTRQNHVSPSQSHSTWKPNNSDSEMASDGGTDLSHNNMEHLLEDDDEISRWQADQLMLEIDDVLHDNVPAHDAIHHSSKPVAVSLSDEEKKIDVNSVPSSDLEVDGMGFPLPIFTKGMLLHPYLSLHLFDLLTDVNVRGFVFGATNALFRQKTNLVDVIVEISDAKIEIHDADLRRQLTLSTADLRFADHLVRSISEESEDLFLNSTEWEGGDDWLRAQFKAYLISLLHTVSFGDERLSDDFNANFVSAWKTTHNYRVWRSSHNEPVNNIPIGHPFHGQLAVSDVKLRISQLIQNTDHNKKINAVVSQTGRVVQQTSKAVGGALNSAKSAVSTWFGSLTGGKN